ncbi:MAG: V-type ATP synthase subunit I [Bacteroidales bacterium]
MLKYSFLVYHKDYSRFLKELRRLGVVHIIEKEKEIPSEIRDKFDHIKEIGNVLKFLSKREIERNDADCSISGAEAFDIVNKAMEEIEQKHQNLATLRKEINLVEPWGDFSLKTLEALKENRIKLRFYTIAQSKFDEKWLEEYPIEVISEHAGQVYFVAVEKGNLTDEIPAEEMRTPEKPLSELLEAKEKLEKEIADINELFDKHARESMDAIEGFYKQMLETVEYDQAIMHTRAEAEEKVMLLEGWVPQPKEADMVEYLEKTSVVYTRQKAVKGDKIPIELKNKKFSQKFEMLGELYSLPKYGELDLTPFFAPFYMVFFGFCLGDAGYGILMAIAATLLKKKVPKELKQTMGLVFYLGLSTIFFGIIGGTFFGIPLYETSLPVYSTLAADLEARGTDINNLLFYLSLALGGVQIIFGLFLKAINEARQYGWKLAIGTIGWIVLLVGSIIVYSIGEFTVVESSSLTPVWYALLGISGSMILLLNNLTRNVFMNLGVGLWDSYNMVTGILGDLLSYIRLFALGISSAILGFVFNSLAVSMSGNIPVLSILIMVIILVIGHGINLFMSGLGAFVHPMRLTFVEFYKNAGFSGGGKKYYPFKKLT